MKTTKNISFNKNQGIVNKDIFDTMEKILQKVQQKKMNYLNMQMFQISIEPLEHHYMMKITKRIMMNIMLK